MPIARRALRLFTMSATCLLFGWCVAGGGLSLVVAADPPVIFAEDFSSDDALRHFVFSSPDHWQRTKVGDRYVLEHQHAGAEGYSPPHRSPHNIALIADRKVGSFVLEYEAQQNGREYGHRDSCVFFNFVDPANYYYIHVATKSDPHAHQIFIVDDKPRTAITRQGTDGFDWGASDEWHKVRVERNVDSGLIRIFVDDMSKPIMEAEDKSHGAGYVGFGSFDDVGRVSKIRLMADEFTEQRPAFFTPKQ